jgi:hypothetical protein
MTDKEHRILQKLIEQANPQSVEDFNKLFNGLIGSRLEDFEGAVDNVSDEDKAFAMVDEAWQSSLAKGQKLAQAALDLWPDCIPAYEYLYLKAKTPARQLEFLKAAVAIGQRIFGGEFRTENMGHFWLISDTRPFMRCLNALAAIYAEQEHQLSKAIVIWEDMIAMNPSDNQGVRYNLFPALLRQRDFKEYRKYREVFEEDSTFMSFNDALQSFMEEGATASSNAILKASVRKNAYVVPLLLAKAPPARNPDNYTFNSPEEAIIYVGDTWQIWRQTPGATDWLQQIAAAEGAKTGKKKAPPLRELSSGALTLLLQEPDSPVSPLQLNPDLRDEDVADQPFLKLAQGFLSSIQAQQPLKLTPKGNLPRKMLQELYDLRLYTYELVDDGTVKLLNENHFPMLGIVHALCEIARLVKKEKGKISFTKKGAKMLQSPAALYRELFDTFTQRFNWAYADGWSFGVEQTGRIGWALMVYELLQQGDQEQSHKYYQDLYLDLLPNIIRLYEDSPGMGAREKAVSDFRSRFFGLFCNCFGLTEVVRAIKDPKYSFLEEKFVKRTTLATRVFSL